MVRWPKAGREVGRMTQSRRAGTVTEMGRSRGWGSPHENRPSLHSERPLALPWLDRMPLSPLLFPVPSL